MRVSIQLAFCAILMGCPTISMAQSVGSPSASPSGAPNSGSPTAANPAASGGSSASGSSGTGRSAAGPETAVQRNEEAKEKQDTTICKGC